MTRALLEKARAALVKSMMASGGETGCDHSLAICFCEEQAAIEAITAELAKPDAEPVAWIFDWYAETDDGGDGLIRDWLTTSYDEAHSPTMGCENIRPLYLRDDA